MPQFNEYEKDGRKRSSLIRVECTFYNNTGGEWVEEEVKQDGFRAEVVIIDELSETDGGPFHETVLKGVLKE